MKRHAGWPKGKNLYDSHYYCTRGGHFVLHCSVVVDRFGKKRCPLHNWLLRTKPKYTRLERFKPTVDLEASK